jgi:hypothetical protein
MRNGEPRWRILTRCAAMRSSNTNNSCYRILGAWLLFLLWPPILAANDSELYLNEQKKAYFKALYSDNLSAEQRLAIILNDLQPMSEGTALSLSAAIRSARLEQWTDEAIQVELSREEYTELSQQVKLLASHLIHSEDLPDFFLSFDENPEIHLGAPPIIRGRLSRIFQLAALGEGEVLYPMIVNDPEWLRVGIDNVLEEAMLSEVESLSLIAYNTDPEILSEIQDDWDSLFAMIVLVNQRGPKGVHLLLEHDPSGVDAVSTLLVATSMMDEPYLSQALPPLLDTLYSEMDKATPVNSSKGVVHETSILRSAILNLRQSEEYDNLVAGFLSTPVKASYFGLTESDVLWLTSYSQRDLSISIDFRLKSSPLWNAEFVRIAREKRDPRYIWQPLTEQFRGRQNSSHGNY